MIEPEALRRRLLSIADAEARVPADHRRAAVAIALREGTGDVLLMRRAVRADDRWSGQISLPGGHAEEGDGDVATTAIRETREEVGLDLDVSSETLGALEPIQARARGELLTTTIVPAVFSVVRVPDELRLGPEADAAFWFPLGRAAAGELDGVHRYSRGEKLVQLPCWDFDEHTVWGLTHMILTGLLEVLALGE